MLKNNGHSFLPNNNEWEWNKQLLWNDQIKSAQLDELGLVEIGSCFFFYCNIFGFAVRTLLCHEQYYIRTIYEHVKCSREYVLLHIAYLVWRVYGETWATNYIDFGFLVWTTNRNVSKWEMNMWTSVLCEYNTKCFLVALNFHAKGKTNQYVNHNVFSLL